MGKTREALILAAICLLLIALSVAGIVETFLEKIELNIDGILLLAVCLMMGGLFSLMLFLIARQQGWIPGGHKKEEAK